MVSTLDKCAVYPRACGGTLAPYSMSVFAMGLSPRLRGNRRSGGQRERGVRSIPAPAGEPVPYT